jgi:hypothetical protein
MFCSWEVNFTFDGHNIARQVDAVSLGKLAERRLDAGGTAAEQDAVGWFHRGTHGPVRY